MDFRPKCIYRAMGVLRIARNVVLAKMHILQLRELRSCELVAMDMGRSMESEATEDVSHFLTVYGSILLIEK